MSSKLERLLDELIKLHPKYIDLSLKRLLVLLNKLDNPHLNLPPVIHIAGTNGKGSTLTYLKYILKENNFLVHSYISPHLESINERFIISNKIIKKQQLLKTLSYVKKVNDNKPITYFEIVTAAAFYLFSKNKADFTLLETGLGGRLDATNVITQSIINIITPISMDHKEFLGNSLTKITDEKLGIIKPFSCIIIGNQKQIVRNHIKKRMKKIKNKKLYFGEDFKIFNENKKIFSFNYQNKCLNFNKPTLKGWHQIENLSVALMAIFKLKEIGYKIKKQSINKGILKSKWPGRLEKGKLNKITVFLDGAHNVDGAEKIANFFKSKSYNRWLIIGMLKNKDLKNFLLQLKSTISGVIAIEIPKEKNSFKANEISSICKRLNIKCIKKKNIIEANKYLLNIAKPKEIVITGSLYLIGKIRKLYV